MSNLNYYGFQGGLPSFSIPWGIWVNKALAESKNINVPDPDWTIDEYTRFFTKSDNTSFWGDKSTLLISLIWEQQQLISRLKKKVQLILTTMKLSHC